MRGLKRLSCSSPVVSHKGRGSQQNVDNLNLMSSVIDVVDKLAFIVQIAGNPQNQDAAKKLLRRIGSMFDPALMNHRQDSQLLQRHRDLAEELDTISDNLCIVRGSQNQKMFTDHTAALYLTKIKLALVDHEICMCEMSYARSLQTLRFAEEKMLDKLNRAPDAGFKSDNSRSSCLKGTRTDVLHTLQAWATDPNGKQIFWLDGHAGSGKTAISQSFAEWLSSERALGASFFCSKSRSQERGDLRAILPSIAYQIVHSTNIASPTFRQCILRTLKMDPYVCWESLAEQLQTLLVDPVTQSGITTIVVIDALDECKDEDFEDKYRGSHHYAFLSSLARIVEYVPTVKFFIASRPDTCIKAGFRLSKLQSATERLSLHNVDYISVSNDIRVFLQAKLKDVVKYPRTAYKFQDPPEWPSNNDVDALVKKADGLFAFANAAIGCIGDIIRDPRERMRTLLADANGSENEATESDGKLDTLYREILEYEFASIHSPEFFSRLRSILSLLVAVYSRGPNAVEEVFETSHTNIARRLGLDVGNVMLTLDSLQSVLLVPEEPEGIVKVHHWAFVDFVADEKRCTNKKFHVSAEEVARTRRLVKARGEASMQ